MVSSTGLPEGIMSQTARGAGRLATASASDDDATAPRPASFFTLSALKSETTTRCPARSSRWAMLPPILPRPTMAISMHASLRGGMIPGIGVGV